MYKRGVTMYRCIAIFLLTIQITIHDKKNITMHCLFDKKKYIYIYIYIYIYFLSHEEQLDAQPDFK